MRNRTQTWPALAFVGPFVIAYLVLFIYPTYKMVALSFTSAPLIGDGQMGRLGQLRAAASDALFKQSVVHTAYFVLLTVVPTTLLGLGIAMMVTRLRGWLQSLVLAAFFLPYVLACHRGVPDLAMGARPAVRHRPVSDPPDARPSGGDVVGPAVGHAVGRLHHHLVDLRVQRAAVHRRACATSARTSTMRRRSMGHAAGRGSASSPGR